MSEKQKRKQLLYVIDPRGLNKRMTSNKAKLSDFAETVEAMNAETLAGDKYREHDYYKRKGCKFNNSEVA